MFSLTWTYFLQGSGLQGPPLAWGMLQVCQVQSLACGETICCQGRGLAVYWVLLWWVFIQVFSLPEDHYARYDNRGPLLGNGTTFLIITTSWNNQATESLTFRAALRWLLFVCSTLPAVGRRQADTSDLSLTGLMNPYKNIKSSMQGKMCSCWFCCSS